VAAGKARRVLHDRTKTVNLPDPAADYPAFVAEKGRAAVESPVGHLVTEEHWTDEGLIDIGNAWTRDHFDDGFWISPVPRDLPAVSLVFVQSRDGNTAAENPADLGGGDTDLHLIYEGLSRVAADAVLAGATTASGRVFFSVWRPEIAALRESLGLPRHPAQIVMTREGRLDLDGTLLFNVPSVPVFILAGDRLPERVARAVADRPWITLVPIEHDDLRASIAALCHYGIRRISAVGGRSAASSLIDAGVVQDLYITTSAIATGQPWTPFYTGRQHIQQRLVVRKRSEPDVDPPIVFEHFTLAISPTQKDSGLVHQAQQ
jgi:riboflavin biosynthesis pyrimidine reductase